MLDLFCQLFFFNRLRQVYALAALSDQAHTATFHIVRYHQAWMEEDRLYIQTELCQGSLAGEVAAKSGLSLHRRYKLLREICLALEFLHNNGMVHLDIKPDNIFVKNDQFKLGDFGLVTKISISSESKSTEDIEEGDSRYMSMELLAGDHSDLTKSDIFSLGATIYEICLGRPLPLNGPEWHDIRSGRLTPLPPPTPPPHDADRHHPHSNYNNNYESDHSDLMTIMEQMLHPNASQRPAASELLQRRQLLSDEQKALLVERTKVQQANMALQQLHHQQQQQQKPISPLPPRRMGIPPLMIMPQRGLRRATTWDGHSLSHEFSTT